MKQQIFTALAVLLYAFTAAAAALADQGDSLAELMQKSGLAKQIVNIPEHMQQEIAQASLRRGDVPDGVRQAITDAATATFNADDMAAGVRKRLSASLDRDDIAAMLSWLNSDLGIRLVKREEEASSPEAYREMSRSTQSLLANSERMAIAKEMDRLFNATDYQTELYLNVQLAIAASFAGAFQPEKAFDYEKAMQELQSQKSVARGSIEQMTLIYLVFIYKDISDADIKSYLDFLHTPAAQKFNDAMMQALVAEFIMRAKLFSQAVAKSIHNKAA